MKWLSGKVTNDNRGVVLHSVLHNGGIKSKTPWTPRGFEICLAVGTGLEPATPCVTGTYSNQLNYPTVAVQRCKSNVNFQLHKLFHVIFTLSATCILFIRYALRLCKKKKTKDYYYSGL